MKKEIPEDQEETNESLPDWSNIDATSIYRTAAKGREGDNKPELNELMKETNNFFKIFAAFLAVLIVVVIVSSYY